MPSPELSLQIARVAAALDARPGESSPIRPALRARILRFLQLTRSAIYPKIFGEETNADRAALLSQAAGELAELLSETVPEKERHEEILLSFFAAIPTVAETLESDVQAAYEGDPAAHTCSANQCPGFFCMHRMENVMTQGFSFVNQINALSADHTVYAGTIRNISSSLNFIFMMNR